MSCSIRGKEADRRPSVSRKDAAVRFLQDVKDDPGRAFEIVDENPRRAKIMAKKDDQLLNPDEMSKSELLDYVSDLEAENADLSDQLDANRRYHLWPG
jgi:hypothetical protein